MHLNGMVLKALVRRWYLYEGRIGDAVGRGAARSDLHWSRMTLPFVLRVGDKGIRDERSD